MKRFSRMKLMLQLYARIFPVVHKELNGWKEESSRIPNQELKKQAQNSIRNKFFHCQGASVYACLLDGDRKNYIRFIVAFQTISDYLDNLCDRSVEQDERHFRQLHLAMSDALHPEGRHHDYYRYGKNQQDGGYLSHLVICCQSCLSECIGYPLIQEKVLSLNDAYNQLQVYKHLSLDIREESLKKWAEEANDTTYDWYSFAAATGSTLGIFMLVAYAMNGTINEQEIEDLYRVYFPSIQGFHILLDYYIDRKEDKEAKDLNFYTYFGSESFFYQQMYAFYWQVSQQHMDIKDGAFHFMIMHALLGMYLADAKVKLKGEASELARRLLEIGGKESRFFYQQVKIYHKLHRGV